MHFEEILIVKDGAVSYGIDTALIDQILRVPNVTPIVLASQEIVGLSAVSGNIVTVYDFQQLMCSKAVDSKQESARLLTMRKGATALLVSAVSNTVLIDPKQIEYLDAPEDAVVALYKHEHDIIQILAIGALFEKVRLRPLSAIEIREGYNNRHQQSGRQSDLERYLFVQMGEEHFAISIELLKEIIALPSEFTQIAGSRHELLGMISLRDQLLNVADLRRFFGFKDALSEKNRVLVAEHKGKLLGLVVDQILDIQEIERSLIEMMPTNFEDQKISGVIRNDQQLISIIGEEVITQLMVPSEAVREEVEEVHKSDVRIEIVLEAIIFKLGKEEYAISIEDVVEIIDAMPVTPFVDAPPYVEGVINIRGQVVTVVSIYEWLGKIPTTTQDRKIIVCQMSGYRIAFCVESVSDVMAISRTQLRKEQHYSTLFSHVIYLEGGKRLALLFDIHQLQQKKVAA